MRRWLRSVWIEPPSSIWAYVGSGGAYDEFHELLKVGRVQIEVSPPPFTRAANGQREGGGFEGVLVRQVLHMGNATLEITTDSGFRATIWADANSPTASFELSSSTGTPVTFTATPRPWRTEPDEHWLSGYPQCNNTPTVRPADTVKAGPHGGQMFYHRNEPRLPSGSVFPNATTLWESSLRLQGPSRAKPASRSLRRALLTPQVNTGSLYRCRRST